MDFKKELPTYNLNNEKEYPRIHVRYKNLQTMIPIDGDEKPDEILKIVNLSLKSLSGKLNK